jgi:WD40 repeat protein
LKKPRLERLPTGNPVAVRFSPDEAVLLISYRNGTILMVDSKKGTCFDVFETKDSGNGPPAISINGEWAGLRENNELVLFHVQNWMLRRAGRTIEGQWRVAAVSPTGGEVLLRTPNEVSLAQIASGFTVRSLHVDNDLSAETSGVSEFSADSRYFAVSAGNLTQWGLVSSAEAPPDSTRALQHLSEVEAAAFLPTASQLVTSSARGTLRVWPLQSATPSPQASWGVIMDNLRHRTRACLTAGDKSALLQESTVVGEVAADKCPQTATQQESRPSVK